MANLFLERTFEPPLTPQGVVDLAKATGWCFETHRVDWNGSLLSMDGQQLLCRFSARDTESVRMALHRAAADMTRLWSGTVHEVPSPREPNVAVERSFTEPVTLESIQALEDANKWCLEARDVEFVRTYFSDDRMRMVCLYAAPDADAVRGAQHAAKMPVDRVWAFARIGPEHLAG